MLSGDSAIVQEPSTFAIDILHLMKATDEVLEIGCGNGRDAAFISSQVANYTGIDACEVAISRSKESCVQKNAKFLVGRMPDDITQSKLGASPSLVYSRFTLHSLTDEELAKTVSAVYNILQNDGSFFIEARSRNDPRCGVGKQVGPGAWIDTHFRNFLDIRDILKLLEGANFQIVSACEEYYRARFKTDLAVVIRVCAKKKKA